jgi:hypothetical protein
VIVRASPRESYPWLLERIGYAPTDRFTAIEAVDASGRIRGMIGYDCWTDNACQAHMAVDAPIVWRSLLRPGFSYPFEELGLGLMLGIIRSDNRASVEMAKALGFRLTHSIQDGAARGVDLLLIEMKREECRWLSPRRKAA